MNNLTLGSLFDGSGGFCLAALKNGITPVWQSEIEPFCIRVTTKRLPQVKHYGDISLLNGAELEPVDIITFGSPCQDISIAGKREGLSGSRSNLFFEAIRIIKEMRNAANGEYPKYIVWENVPGAFSSNNGEDFRAVLEAICRIRETDVFVPQPEKWANAGEIVGDSFSIAWRVLDAQRWGVPQRRKRIFLVGDLNGQRAGKILFESESVSGNTAQSIGTRQTAAGSIEAGSGAAGAERIVCAGFCTEHSAKAGNIGFEEEKSPTLRAAKTPAVMTAEVYENHAQDARYNGPLGTAPAVSATYGNGGNNQPLVTEPKPVTLKIRAGCEGGGKGALIRNDSSATLSCNNDQTVFVPKAYGVCSKHSNSMLSDNPKSGFYEADTSRTLDTGGGNPACNQGGIAVVEGNGTRPSHHGDGYKQSDVMYTLNATEQHGVAYGIDRAASNQGKNALYNFAVEEELEPTVVATGPGAVAHPVYTTSKASFFCSAKAEFANPLVATDYKDPPVVNEPYYIVRRLTPTECARLQGFPDAWCADLGTDNPTDEEIDFWREVFQTYAEATRKSSKPKTDRQIIKWLKNPHTDSAEYRMWGNGIALPCAVFVLRGIVWAHNRNCV